MVAECSTMSSPSLFWRYLLFLKVLENVRGTHEHCGDSAPRDSLDGTNFISESSFLQLIRPYGGFQALICSRHLRSELKDNLFKSRLRS